MSLDYLPRPAFFHLQWHLTERCNWQCKHCYQEEQHIREELSTKQLCLVFNQFIELIAFWGAPRFNAELSLTGGEPFLRKDLFQLIEYMQPYRHLFTLNILSNGSLIDKKLIEKIKSHSLKNIQVSLEGLQQTNDEIRGKGSFNKTKKAIGLLVNAGIAVTISFTASKKNVSELKGIVDFCEEMGASKLGVRRLVPFGVGKQLQAGLLSPAELRGLYHKTALLNNKLQSRGSQLRIVRGCEEGPFSVEGTKKDNNTCGVGSNLMVVQPNGRVVACRRMPISLGNVLEQSLKDIYYKSKKIWALRNISNDPQVCKQCLAYERCYTGAKCVSYSYFKKLNQPDPQCWRLYKVLPTKPEPRVASEKIILNHKQLIF